MILKKILESRTKIRFHDCDPFNHLHNSRYIDYILTARSDQLKDHYGLDIYKLGREQGVGWVTAQTQISYLIPAYLMEEVTIQTRLISFTKKSLLFEGLMWNHDQTALKVLMWTKLVHYNVVEQSTHMHSADLLALFEQIAYPLPMETGFESRIKEIRTI